jgi:hypothetical protein
VTTALSAKPAAMAMALMVVVSAVAPTGSEMGTVYAVEALVGVEPSVV